ncbi:hypothetical protein GCM10020221_06540 [Streptomyces thioluteus]|uniref:Uncharacterized protein n=1 Tax=Streptomyces thioluteus TaxID=66431 RepID=A0ABN3WFI4_STRTU
MPEPISPAPMTASFLATGVPFSLFTYGCSHTALRRTLAPARTQEEGLEMRVTSQMTDITLDSTTEGNTRHIRARCSPDAHRSVRRRRRRTGRRAGLPSDPWST